MYQETEYDDGFDWERFEEEWLYPDDWWNAKPNDFVEYNCELGK